MEIGPIPNGEPYWSLPAKVRLQGTHDRLSATLTPVHGIRDGELLAGTARKRHYPEQHGAEAVVQRGRRRISLEPPEAGAPRGRRFLTPLAEEPSRSSQRQHTLPPVSRVDEKLFQSLARVSLNGARLADQRSAEFSVAAEMGRRKRQEDLLAMRNNLPPERRPDPENASVSWLAQSSHRELTHQDWLFEKETRRRMLEERDHLHRRRPDYRAQRRLEALNVARMEVAALPKEVRRK